MTMLCAEQSAYSTEMVSVYLSALTLIGVIVKFITEAYDKAQRRKWEVEDRAYKNSLTLKTDASAKAAAASARLAATGSKEVIHKIEESKKERAAQMGVVIDAVAANTALTQSAKDASQVALDVANGHNDKIAKATELAEQALNRADRSKD